MFPPESYRILVQEKLDKTRSYRVMDSAENDDVAIQELELALQRLGGSYLHIFVTTMSRSEAISLNIIEPVEIIVHASD